MRRSSLEAVDQTAVGPQLEILHNVLQADQVPNVEAGRVLELVGCRVEVEQVDGAAERLGVRNERGAKGGFAGACGAGDEHGVCARTETILVSLDWHPARGV
jgi:hypothetical protein